MTWYGLTPFEVGVCVFFIVVPILLIVAAVRSQREQHITPNQLVRHGVRHVEGRKPTRREMGRYDGFEDFKA